MSKTRVVITGLGATTPLGGDVSSTWEGLLAGRSGARRLTDEWVQNLAVQIAAPAAGTGAVSFWWDTVRRLGHWQRNIPNLFWEGGVAAPQVAMHFGRISPRALAELWRPDSQSQQVSDLNVAPADRPDVQSDAAQTMQRWLETPGTTVSEFLSAL